MTNIITSSAALLTSILTLLIVLEMKEQRIASSKPIIKIISKQNEFDSSKSLKELDKGIPLYYSKIELHNLGNGPAFNIRINCSYDLDSFEGQIRNEFDSSYKINKKLMFPKKTIHIDSLTTKKNKHTYIPLCNNPTMLYSIFDDYVTKIVDTFGTDLKSESFAFLPINIKIEYNDINERTIVQNFRLQYIREYNYIFSSFIKNEELVINEIYEK